MLIKLYYSKTIALYMCKQIANIQKITKVKMKLKDLDIKNNKFSIIKISHYNTINYAVKSIRNIYLKKC